MRLQTQDHSYDHQESIFPRLNIIILQVFSNNNWNSPDKIIFMTDTNINLFPGKMAFAEEAATHWRPKVVPRWTMKIVVKQWWIRDVHLPGSCLKLSMWITRELIVRNLLQILILLHFLSINISSLALPGLPDNGNTKLISGKLRHGV